MNSAIRSICLDMKLSSDERIFLRKTVLDMFPKVRGIALSFGYDSKIFDGRRSISLQKALFWFYFREFTAQKFGIAHTLKLKLAPLFFAIVLL